jgi:hypothetical protein
MYVHMYVIYTYMNSYIYMYMHTHVLPECVLLHVNTHTYVCTSCTLYICIYMNICIYIYIYYTLYYALLVHNRTCEYTSYISDVCLHILFYQLFTHIILGP